MKPDWERLFTVHDRAPTPSSVLFVITLFVLYVVGGVYITIVLGVLGLFISIGVLCALSALNILFFDG